MASLPSPTQVARDHFGLYDSWYKVLDPKNCGSIQAGPAAQFLKKSGLNDNILSRIWDLSDPGGKGYLDKAGLFAALKMVALAQNGKEPNLANINIVTPSPNMGDPPPHPPPPKSPGPPLVPAPPAPTQINDLGVWTITPVDRARYDQIFNSLGPEANKIHGNKVRGVMMNSKLPTDILGKIWDHADMDKDGSLDKVEFSIAMHLIYKVLENNSLPTTLPQEMLSSARRAGVAAQGPVPAPLAPPTHMQPIAEVNKCQNTGPPPVPWVVSSSDKSRYDIMFHNADLDKDGFVSGQEIKGVFLQSGLPQMVLAHIWNICDIKQTGKLTSEQFALAMWLIQQKIAGIDPPSTLTAEMIPPTMRPKPSGEAAVQVVSKPTYSNPELQSVADEIEEVSKDRLKLEADIQQKEASIRLKNNEAKNLQTELDTLTATFRQLENQKGAAQKKLDDLGRQLAIEQELILAADEQIRLESIEVEALRVQVEEQETSLKSQEDEVMSKQKELNDLRNQEMELESSIITTKKKTEQFAKTQQETQLFISQAKTKIEELQEQEIHLTEVLTNYDLSIESNDASNLSEASLIDITPMFNDLEYMTVGPLSPKAPTSPLESPSTYLPEVNGIPNAAELNFQKGKDTSFIDGHDPFAQAFGGHKSQADPFASWDHKSANHNPAPAHVDPFGGDAFAANNPDAFGTESFSKKDSLSESPTPALPPKKSKQPPPRPAPPKTRPAKPPPPQMNSNNNDPFTGGWHEGSKTTNASSKSSGFADFANFADFESKYSSTSSSSLRSPWGDESGSSKNNSFGASILQTSDNARTFSHRIDKLDPFDDTFGSGNPLQASAASPWPVNSPSSGFGSQNGSDHHPLETGDNFTADDPFGGDYDPFKDTTVIKEADEFSWDDEPEGAFTDSVSDGSFAPPLTEQHDPFCLSSDDSPENKRTVIGLSGLKKSIISPISQNLRSKSALGDPLNSLENLRKVIPLRSKTSLGNPGKLELDFDPLSASPKVDFPTKSNEDLLNENFNSSFSSTPGINTFNRDQCWNSSKAVFNNNLTKSSASVDPFAAFDNVWTMPDNSRLEEESRKKRLKEQEQADLEFAIALSRSQNQPSTANSYKHKNLRSSRSPSTGL